MGRLPIHSFLIRAALLGLTGFAAGCGGHGPTRVLYQDDSGDYSDGGGGCDCEDPGVVDVDGGSAGDGSSDEGAQGDGSSDDGSAGDGSSDSGDSSDPGDDYEDDYDDYHDDGSY
jgi:hypothetical protein